MDPAQKAAEFKNQYNNTHIDEDGYYGAQCWDVVARYAREKYGCPSFPTGSGGAEGLYRIFADPIGQYFDKKPASEAKAGDIGVCPGSFSPPWGHTFIILARNGNTLTVFEQNGNNPGGNAYVTTRYVSQMSGVLRPKEQNMSSTVDINVLRIIHSEMEGWPLKETHEGKFDAQFIAAWGGTETNSFVFQKWMQNGDFRTARETWRNFYLQYSPQIATLLATQDALKVANNKVIELSTQIGDLNKRPTQAQLDALQKAATDAQKAAMEAQKALEAKTSSDAAADKQVEGLGRSILRKLRELGILS